MAKVREATTGRFLASGRETSGRIRCRSALVKGFVDGVGAGTFVVEATKQSPRTYKGRGLKGDWVAVGESLRRARSAG
jgi:hypothetical protein